MEDCRAVIYARWCIEPDNKLVPKYVKKQAAIWLDIVEGKDEEAAVAAIQNYFVENL